MSVIPPVFGYVFGGAITWLVSACSSEDPKPVLNKAQDLAIPTPPEPKPTLSVNKDAPEYKIYEALKSAGISDAEMDQTSSFWSTDFRSSPLGDQGSKKGDGKISDVDLMLTAKSLYPRGPQFREIVDKTFQGVADQYIPADFGKGDPSRFCGNEVPFQKALFWDEDNVGAHYLLGVCQSSPSHLYSSLSFDGDPSFRPAKVALENYYRKKLKEDPKDLSLYMGLGHALDIQNKYDEAVAAYKKALPLQPIDRPIDRVHIYETIGKILEKQGKYAEADVYFNKAVKIFWEGLEGKAFAEDGFGGAVRRYVARQHLSPKEEALFLKELSE